jgi:hypothetical protein
MKNFIFFQQTSLLTLISNGHIIDQYQPIGKYEYQFMQANLLDVKDCKPCDYSLMISKPFELKCTRPLYLSNQISIISTVDLYHDYEPTKCLKVYNWKVWLVLEMIIFFLIAFTLIIRKVSLRKAFWSFVNPLFHQNVSTRAINCFTYTTYLLALIPFIEIIRNELLINLVTIREFKVDTIDDLLNPKIRVYMFDDKDYWLKEIEMLDEEGELKDKLKSLFHKTKHYSLQQWFEFTLNSGKIGRNYAAIEDEYSMEWFQVIV